jgi:hypothetical protein
MYEEEVMEMFPKIFSLRFLLTRRANGGKPSPQFTQRIPHFGLILVAGLCLLFAKANDSTWAAFFQVLGSTHPTGKEPVNRLWGGK